MKLATLRDGTPDGRLVAISEDGTRFLTATEVVPTLQAALEGWSNCLPLLEPLLPVSPQERASRWTWRMSVRRCPGPGNGSMDRLLPAMAR